MVLYTTQEFHDITRAPAWAAGAIEPRRQARSGTSRTARSHRTPRPGAPEIAFLGRVMPYKGVGVAILAPLVFKGVWEYPLLLVMALGALALGRPSPSGPHAGPRVPRGETGGRTS